MAVNSLQDLLGTALKQNNEEPGDLYSIVITDGAGFRANGAVEVSFEELAEYEGDTGFGGQNLPRLHAWTEDRVYFKNVYDGAESVQSVPRNPDTEESPGFYGGG